MNVMTAKPIGMLESLVLTIYYKPDYRKENDALACEVPDPVTVAIPQIYVERFLNEVDFYLNLEEYEELDDDHIIAQHIPQYKNWCPQIINAMYVDMMGKVDVVDLRDCYSQYPSALDMQR